MGRLLCWYFPPKTSSIDDCANFSWPAQVRSIRNFRFVPKNWKIWGEQNRTDNFEKLHHMAITQRELEWEKTPADAIAHCEH